MFLLIFAEPIRKQIFQQPSNSDAQKIDKKIEDLDASLSWDKLLDQLAVKHLNGYYSIKSIILLLEQDIKSTYEDWAKTEPKLKSKEASASNKKHEPQKTSKISSEAVAESSSHREKHVPQVEKKKSKDKSTKDHVEKSKSATKRPRETSDESSDGLEYSR